MGDGGFKWTIFEIFELAMAVSILIVIGSAILIAPSTDFQRAKITSAEVSYISSLISDSDFSIDTKYKDTELKTETGEIVAKYKKKESSYPYFGSEVKINNIDSDNQQISSN